MKKLKINICIIAVLLLLSACGKTDNKTTEGKSENIKEENSSGEIVEIQLPTMQCGTCKKNIEKAVKKIDGVNEVNVSVKDKKAKVNFDKTKTDLSKIEGAIVMTGYQANDKPANKDAYEKLEKCCQLGGHDN